MIEAIKSINFEETDSIEEPEIELELEEFLELITVDEDNQDSINNDGYWLVFFKGRNTSTVVTANSRDEAISKAKNKKVAGSDGEVVSARQANEDESKAIRNGTWLRVRANGSTNSNSGSYKFRPQLKKKAKGREVGV